MSPTMQQKCPPATVAPPTDPEDDFKDFAYIVSHDLAGPVRSIVSFSQILAEKGEVLGQGEDAKLHLDLIIDSGRKLNEMIQGLLAFSRLNTVPRAVTGCDLEIVVARCNMELQPLIDLLKARLIYPAMPEITADPSRMFTLFYNLIENGLKFHREHVAPEVRLTCEDNGDCWLFTASDNGIGIDPIFYDDVFRPLRKLHTDDAYPGAGMGLTLARKIVFQHGGNMWLEPSDMGGVKVSFTISKAPPVTRE